MSILFLSTYFPWWFFFLQNKCLSLYCIWRHALEHDGRTTLFLQCEPCQLQWLIIPSKMKLQNPNSQSRCRCLCRWKKQPRKSKFWRILPSGPGKDFWKKILCLNLAWLVQVVFDVPIPWKDSITKLVNKIETLLEVEDLLQHCQDAEREGLWRDHPPDAPFENVI